MILAFLRDVFPSQSVGEAMSRVLRLTKRVGRFFPDEHGYAEYGEYGETMAPGAEAQRIR